MRQRIREDTVYKFSELDERAQDRAITRLWDLNVNHDWWDCTYADAARVGLKITEFGLDRHRHVKGHLTMTLRESSDAIKAEHGKSCDTFELAIEFEEGLAPYDMATRLNCDLELDDPADKLTEEYVQRLCEEYASILQREYDYMTSREQIVESIEANEYEFDEEGRIAR